MNGPHDLGGQDGLGPIRPESEYDEPVFHASWEQRVFALTLAAGASGQWNLDQSRHARERQHPIAYLSHSYYCLLYTSPSPRDATLSRMPSSA